MIVSRAFRRAGLVDREVIHTPDPGVPGRVAGIRVGGGHFDRIADLHRRAVIGALELAHQVDLDLDRTNAILIVLIVPDLHAVDLCELRRVDELNFLTRQTLDNVQRAVAVIGDRDRDGVGLNRVDDALDAADHFLDDVLVLLFGEGLADVHRIGQRRVVEAFGQEDIAVVVGRKSVLEFVEREVAVGVVGDGIADRRSSVGLVQLEGVQVLTDRTVVSQLLDALDVDRTVGFVSVDELNRLDLGDLRAVILLDRLHVRQFTAALIVGDNDRDGIEHRGVGHAGQFVGGNVLFDLVGEGDAGFVVCKEVVELSRTQLRAGRAAQVGLVGLLQSDRAVR